MTSGVRLVPGLARGRHDRVAYRRRDDAWLTEAWSRAQVLDVSTEGSVPVGWTAKGAVLVFRPTGGDERGDTVLLGEADGTAYFARLGVQADGGAAPNDAWFPAAAEEGVRWSGLRQAGPVLGDLDTGLMTAAVALANWHAGHTHCPRCGTATEVVDAGWSTRCPQDGSLHFPRTDPAVIMLVHDGADRCVLGRQASWPEGRFSILAGFVEPGESLEAAVAREVDEEVGLAVSDIAYLASQPWPFPASIMLGFTARLVGDPTIRRRDDELVEADWFTKDDVRRATEAVDSGLAAPHPRLRMSPPGISIASTILRDWIAH